MKSLPLLVQPPLYGNGQYCQITANSQQVIFGMSSATGMNNAFLEPYYVLKNLPGMSQITDDSTNTFLFLSNDTTHEPMLLQEPDYTPEQIVNNAQYDKKNADRFVVDGKELLMENEYQMTHYHANMAALIQLGNWFDYLRECGVYDNTRIILVSDHGRQLSHFTELMELDPADYMTSLDFYYPLLMVKDFDSKEFVTSHDFMTNADVPTLAVNNLIENATNPYTGKAITNDEKYAHPQFIICSNDWETSKNNGNTYLPSRWASVQNDLWNRENWILYDGSVVLKEHRAP